MFTLIRFLKNIILLSTKYLKNFKNDKNNIKTVLQWQKICYSHCILSKVGFTLIEISVVLVIIGLIVGGVLIGKDLIESSEVRAQISQIEEFKTAANTFKVKYGYIPGDMPPTVASQLGFFTFTGEYAGSSCNSSAFGNNDGVINQANESYVFWSHLSDAKMIKGSYGGTAGNLLKTSTTSCNASAGNPIVYPTTYSDYGKFDPSTKIYRSTATSFISVMGNRRLAPNTTIIFSDTTRQNIFNAYDSNGDNPVSSPYIAYQIDSKIDDSLPASGNVRIYGTADHGSGTPNSDPPCTTTTAPFQYDLNTTTAYERNCWAINFLF